MEVGKSTSGFTVVEVVVSLIVMSVFLTLLFQLYMATQSQQLAARQLASANDIAQSNLRKITAKSQIPSGNLTCRNENNLLITSNPTDTYSKMTLTDSSTIQRENLASTSLPSTAVQEIQIVYPRGCGDMPARITSTVKYGSETVSRATYVN